ncbi:MAG: hypothetical protein WAL64_09095 [Candidatus Dormiibacterota bacterium]
MPVLRRSAIALASLAVLAVAGCGSPAATAHRSARAILDAANQRALGTSFELSFSSKVQVDLTGVSGLSGVTPGELGLIQAKINSAQLQGVVDFQSQKLFELSFSVSPLLDQTWHLIDLNGTRYISENGTQWHTVTGNSGLAGGVGSVASGGLSNLKAELQTWGQELHSSATVTNLGNSQLNGAEVDHVQTSVSGPALNHALAQVLSGLATQLGTAEPSLSGEVPAIEKLLQFNSAKVDSYVGTPSGQLARTEISVGMTLDLGSLSALAPGQSDLPSGSMSMTIDATGNLSKYGKNFGIQKPSDIVAGPLPAPSGLGAALAPS